MAIAWVWCVIATAAAEVVLSQSRAWTCAIPGKVDAQCQSAEFGVNALPRGGLFSPLILLEPDDAADGSGCDPDILAERSDTVHGRPIFVVWRGGCSFFAKAEAAKKSNAAGLIVVNNIPNSEAFPMAHHNEDPAPEIPLPVAMISHGDGQHFLKTFQEHLKNPHESLTCAISDSQSDQSNTTEEAQDRAEAGGERTEGQEEELWKIKLANRVKALASTGKHQIALALLFAVTVCG